MTTPTYSLPTAQAVYDSPSPDLFIGLDPSGAGRQTNLRERLDDAILTVRAAETAIEAREALDEATSLLERLCDRAITCHCGGLLDRLTGVCDLCIERREQMTAARDHAGATALDIDPFSGF